MCVCLRPQRVYLLRTNGRMCERLKDNADLMRVVCKHMHLYEPKLTALLLT